MTGSDTLVPDNDAPTVAGRFPASLLPDALAPVADAVLARARATASLLVAAASADAAAVRARAEDEVVELLAEADRIGRERAQARRAADEHRAARARLSEIFAAQRVRYDRRRSFGIEAVLGLRDTPEYPQLLDGLRAAALRVLGPNARITEDAAGGLIARAPGRVLDLRLRTIAGRAVDRLESRNEGFPK